MIVKFRKFLVNVLLRAGFRQINLNSSSFCSHHTSMYTAANWLSFPHQRRLGNKHREEFHHEAACLGDMETPAACCFESFYVVSIRNLFFSMMNLLTRYDTESRYLLNFLFLIFSKKPKPHSLNQDELRILSIPSEYSNILSIRFGLSDRYLRGSPYLPPRAIAKLFSHDTSKVNEKYTNSMCVRAAK
jgi:hypothetical protein